MSSAPCSAHNWLNTRGEHQLLSSGLIWDAWSARSASFVPVPASSRRCPLSMPPRSIRHRLRPCSRVSRSALPIASASRGLGPLPRSVRNWGMISILLESMVLISAAKLMCAQSFHHLLTLRELMTGCGQQTSIANRSVVGAGLPRP